ncbi:MAG: class I SAM-dependent methyltransferase [Deltaproteobacteria bacterium]|nr:class I SAM-dependent methyltransferase [Deltaproteobacteria bacterium]
MAGNFLTNWLKEKEVQGEVCLDDPRTTLCHREIIRRKKLLRQFYLECYAFFARAAREVPPGVKLELGSGGGFLKEVMPEVVTTEYLILPGVDLVCSALRLPFPDRALSAIFLMDVLHHLIRPREFFAEALRCLQPGGVMVLVEPAHTAFSRLVYRYLHHEPFEPDTAAWELPPGGPLSNANMAMPWQIFVRDRAKFQTLFPGLVIREVSTGSPLSYLLSGGVSLRQMVPDAATGLVTRLEKALAPWNDQLGLFMRVVLERV